MKLNKSPKASYRAIAPDRFKLRLIGHYSGVGSICFNHDESLMLSSGYDNPIVQWDTATGCMTKLLPPGRIVCGVPDSNLVLINDNRGLVIRDSISGKLLRRFRDNAEAVAVSSDGSLVACSQDGVDHHPRIVVSEMLSDITILNLQLPDVYLVDLAICHKRRELTVCYFASGRGVEISYELLTVAFDGREISRGRTADELVRLFIRHSCNTVCVTDGKCVWDAKSLAVISKAPEHLKYGPSPHHLVWYSDTTDEIVFGGQVGRASAWSVATGSGVMDFEANHGWGLSVVQSKEAGLVYTGGHDHLIRLWDRAGILIRQFGRPLVLLSSVAIQSEEIVTCTALGGAYWRVNVITGELREAGQITCAWGYDGRVGDAYIDDLKAIRGLAAKRVDGRFEIRVSLDGRRAVTRHDQEIEITDLDTGLQIGRMPLNDRGCCFYTTMSNDGSLYSLQSDRSLDLISLDSCEIITSHAMGHDTGKMSFNQSGTHLIYVYGWAADCSVLDLATNVFNKKSRLGLEAYAFAIAPDGITAAAGSAYEPWLGLHNIETGKRSARFVGHEAGLRGASFSLDGKRQASVGNDGLMNIWDVQSHRLLVTFAPLPDDNWITYTPDGYYIGSEGAEDYFVWTDGRKVVESGNYAAERRSPERVAAALA